jgi:hypothetical protein
MFDDGFIDGLRTRLDRHPIYESLHTLDDLRVFMSHHVYSVWDFMSLIKYLQHAVAPASWPWQPGADPAIQRFINELVLEEETDVAGPDCPNEFTSHFQLYLRAMGETGADAEIPLRFVALAVRDGVAAALDSSLAPRPAAEFSRTTFGFIDAVRPHVAAAALALGREHVIPAMFRAFLGRMGITEQQAPVFHYYLRRHIHLDEDFHAPLSLRLLQKLCADDPARIAEARSAAERAVDARIVFWDGVLAALPSRMKGA